MKQWTIESTKSRQINTYPCVSILSSECERVCCEIVFCVFHPKFHYKADLISTLLLVTSTDLIQHVHLCWAWDGRLPQSATYVCTSKNILC